jgi:hypothetical protein
MIAHVWASGLKAINCTKSPAHSCDETETLLKGRSVGPDRIDAGELAQIPGRQEPAKN